MKYHLIQLVLVFSLTCAPVDSLLRKSKTFLTLYNYLAFEIFDLESSNETFFADDVSKWKAQNNLTNKLYTTCGTTLLLGGVGVLDNHASLKRTYDDLPYHEGIMGELTFWFIDDWEEKDTLYLSLASESQEFYNDRILATVYNSGWSGSVCGNSNFGDLTEVKYYFISYHTGKNLTLQIINKLVNSSDRVYYGIRNIKILLLSSMAARSTLSCGSSNFHILGYKCNCLANTYFNGVGCNLCDSACDHCSGAGSNNCIICPSNRYFDGTYCNACNSSCKTCSGANENECISCEPGRFLYQNSTCLSYCDPPFSIKTSNSISYCDFPCNSSSFLNDNGTCTNSCSLPSKERAYGDNKYCIIDCNASSYVYPDGSCFSYCRFPMRITNDTYNLYCLTPCKDDNDFYYPNEKECSSACVYPYAPKNELLYSTCELPNIESMVFFNEDFTDIINKGMMVTSLLFVGHSWGISVTVLARMFQNIRYVNNSYDSYSYNVLKNFNSSIPNFQFMPKISSESKTKIPYHAIPATFEMYGIHSSFLVNFWQTFISISVVALSFALFKFLEQYLGKIPRISFIIRLLRVFFQNATLVILYANYGDAVLFSIIEFKYNNLDTNLGILGFILSIIFLILIFVSVILHLWFLIERQKMINHLEITDHEKNLQAFTFFYQGYKVLVQDFKYKYQIFIFLFLLRDLLANLIIGFFAEYKFYQVVIITALHLSIVIYTASQWPFKSNLDNFQQIFREFLLLVANVSALAVTIFDEANIQETGLREYFGKAIVVTNNISKISVVAFFMGKVLLMLYGIYEARQQSNSNKSVEISSFGPSKRTFDVTNDSSLLELQELNQFNLNIIHNKQKVVKGLKPNGNLKKGKAYAKAWKRKLITEVPKESKKIRIPVGKLAEGESLGLESIKNLQPKKTPKFSKAKPVSKNSNFLPDLNQQKDINVVEFECKEKDIRPITLQEYSPYRSSNMDIPRRFVFKKIDK